MTKDFTELNKKYNDTNNDLMCLSKPLLCQKIIKLKDYLKTQEVYFLKYSANSEKEISALKKKVSNLEYENQTLTDRLNKYEN